MIEVVDRVKKLLPQLQATLPGSVDVVLLTDRTTTIRASVRDVQFELMLAVALVVMVIFLFLRSPSATVIPSVAVPLSLVGTFGVMYLAGFSINNLTLMALTIATGFVVDDAIVMIENIARYIEAGETPLKAALKGAEQIGFTIISLTFSLIAVLIPLLFMGDVVGTAVPRVRHHARGGDPDLGRGFADADADDVREAAAPHAQSPSRAGSIARSGRVLRQRDRALRRDARLGAGPPGRDAAGRDRHAGAHRAALHLHAQRLLPGAGHGRDPGHFRSAAVDLLLRDGASASRRSRAWCCRTRRSRACRRSSAWTASTRR